MPNSIINKYSKEELQQIVRQSFSFKEVADKLGYSTHTGRNHITIQNRLKNDNIDFSHFCKTKKSIKRSKEDIFIKDSTACQHTLRKWYKKGKYTPYICSICGQEPKWQNKPLTLILDHINGKNKDNRLENLRWVCPNCNQQLETTGYKKMRTIDKPLKRYYCIDCGKEVTQKSLRCIDCLRKEQEKQRKVSISREELKSLIRTTPFTAIGKQYGVTDNAMRKWCDKYNLPRTKKEILSYSDEEWEKI